VVFPGSDVLVGCEISGHRRDGSLGALLLLRLLTKDGMRLLEVTLVDLVVLQISKLIDTERMRRLKICTCVLFGVIRSVVLQNREFLWMHTK
jgi:hypothetical protein